MIIAGVALVLLAVGVVVVLTLLGRRDGDGDETRSGAEPPDDRRNRRTSDTIWDDGYVPRSR